MKTSVRLAKARGPFPAIDGSIYDPANLSWEPPQPLTPYQRDFNRPELDWDAIVTGIKTHGIRNAAQTTIAPTGTIATVSGCEGYGCEPVFALAYIRHVDDRGTDLTLTYTSPLFEQALLRAGVPKETREKIIEQVIARGSCQGIPELPEGIANTFVVSGDITAEAHVRMQGAMQAFIDNSLSKTINFPADASEEDVATAYQLAWELGCKGITVYVTGSREKVVLETHETAKEKQAEPAHKELPVIWNKTKKPRPRALMGRTYHIQTPVGKAFVTVNENGNDQPFEVFLNTAKAGSETAAVSEAIGRLLSYILRLASPVAPRKRLYEIYRQLRGIGGSRSSGFGPNRVSSLPDGVSQIIGEYLEETAHRFDDEYNPLTRLKTGNGKPAQDKQVEEPEPGEPRLDIHQVGDICPDCGHASVINEEGCRKCYNCAYSEC
jgi:ribonucleoside-diphosphate reductase alpha chain